MGSLIELSGHHALRLTHLARMQEQVLVKNSWPEYSVILQNQNVSHVLFPSSFSGICIIVG